MQAVAPFQEAVDIIKEEGGDIAKLCYQCGLCTGTCPWNLVRSFLVRKTMHQAQLGLPDFEDDDMWLCVTCNACVKRCPRGVEIIDVWRSFRRAITELGIGGIPDALRITSKNISGVGNPQGEDREKRNDWTRDLGVKTFTKGMEILYMPCCYNAYDPQLQPAARATVEILKKANVDFGILGPEQSCCGESVRKAGNESLFQSLAQSNIGLFNEAGVTRIITASPHCFHTFKNEYPELEGKYEVVHFVQFLSELVKDGRLEFTKELKKTITYHDSCYLGRHNDIYDEPREVLQAIPGVELVEMANHHEDSLCCGGGGGRIWAETKKGERFSDIRLEQAADAGASVLAAVCPYCIANFKDSIVTMNKEDVIECKDIAELVLEAL
ncbi:MAG: Fe-S oxidoreductase [Chloroflexi bacterium]|jgi:Fe-S oxidoreductase|nr:MAG: Fe-S oxidoreductase [Chloroflexota bacterium]